MLPTCSDEPRSITHPWRWPTLGSPPAGGTVLAHVVIDRQSKTATAALLGAVVASLDARTVFEPDDHRSVELGAGPVVAKKLLEAFDMDEAGVLDEYDHRLLLCRDSRDRFVSWLLWDIHSPARR